MTWDDCLEALEHRTGMYVPYPYYPAAVGFLTGFDVAQEKSLLEGFQRWMSGRHAGSSLAFASLALAEFTGKEVAEEYWRYRDVGFEQQVEAVRHLCRLLREYRSAGEAARPSAVEPE